MMACIQNLIRSSQKGKENICKKQVMTQSRCDIKSKSIKINHQEIQGIKKDHLNSSLMLNQCLYHLPPINPN